MRCHLAADHEKKVRMIIASLDEVEPPATRDPGLLRLWLLRICLLQPPETEPPPRREEVVEIIKGKRIRRILWEEEQFGEITPRGREQRRKQLEKRIRVYDSQIKRHLKSLSKMRGSTSRVYSFSLTVTVMEMD